MNAVSMYVRYVSASARAQMQYRVSFLLQCFGHFLITGGEYLGVWALFNRFGRLGEWQLAEVALLYGTVNIAYAVADSMCTGFEGVGQQVKRGDFDRLLLRPRGLILQLLGQELRLKALIGRGLQGVVITAWAISALGPWPAANYFLMGITILGGIALFLAIRLLHATWSFWTIEALEIMELIAVGGSESAHFPMSIYRSWLRNFFTYVVPVAAISYYPILTLLDHPEGKSLPTAMGWLAPCAGALFFMVAYQIWRFGVKHYQSTGS